MGPGSGVAGHQDSSLLASRPSRARRGRKQRTRLSPSPSTALDGRGVGSGPPGQTETDCATEMTHKKRGQNVKAQLHFAVKAM